MSSKLRWEQLQKGDIVDVIAPSGASQFSRQSIEKIKSYLKSLGLIPRISEDIFAETEDLIKAGYDPFCANTDEIRLKNLVNAIHSNSKAIWAIAGGCGAARLIDGLNDIVAPIKPKLVIGFSDITVLHLFFQNKWRWPTIHGDVLSRLVSVENKESLNLIEQVLFNPDKIIYSDFTALNESARKKQTISAEITGGNLCLVEASIGTSWEIDSKDKIVFLEEVDERGYRVDRSFEHLIQSDVLGGAKAIILGDFTPGYEKDGKDLTRYAIKRFAANLDIPVVSAPCFGHNDLNYPLPLGTECELILKNKIKLKCSTGAEI